MAGRHHVFSVFECEFTEDEWTRQIENWGVRYLAQKDGARLRITPAPGANGQLWEEFKKGYEVAVVGGLIHIPV